MSFATVAMVVSAGVGVAKAIQGGVQAKKAKEDAAKAKIEVDKQRNAFANLDTSNPFVGMENVMEDLTVNQQEAEFTKQQQMQSQANIMGSMKGAAGSSGVAGLAQAMAQQASTNAQQASISIGKQEAGNQRARQSEQGRIQDAIIGGEQASRAAVAQKTQGLLGFADADLQGANSRRQAGQEAMMEGFKDVATSAVDYGLNTGAIQGGVSGQNVSSTQMENLVNNAGSGSTPVPKGPNGETWDGEKWVQA